MKLISFNVNGIRATVKKGLFESIEKMNPDVLCLQETKANDAQVREALFGLEGYEIYSNSAERPGYSGTAILTKQKPLCVTKGLSIAEHDDQGRCITAEYEDFYLVNTYVPNSGQGLVRLDYRTTWDAALLNYLKTLEQTKPVIWCGDMNVAHKPIDLANPKSNYNKTAGYTQREIDGMDAVHAAGFIDTFRHLYPDVVKYSWWSARFNSRAKNVGWRIDYFMISPSLLPRLKDAFILNEIEGSDHCPVGIEIL
ncbi:MAG TPA: exodeoxyribonuclease III [Flavobacteriales bacterium]|jgi:exodeoxyribonuclease-3